MSSRGAYAKNGHITTTEYKKDHMVLDAKVLVGQNRAHSLPDYAHTHSSVYIKENSDGSFRELRLYNEESGRLEIEVAFHPEPNINNGNRTTPILHYHLYNEDLVHGAAHKLESDHPIYERVKKYLEVYGL